MIGPPENDEIADVLEQVAHLLQALEANPFRARAFDQAARTLRRLGEPVAVLVDRRGLRGLEELPGIGPRIAAVIGELLSTGRLGLLDRLEATASSEDLFTSLPGIGQELAHRLRQELGPIPLEDLELAAHDGRLEGVAGFGPRRVRLVRDALDARLRRSACRRARCARPRRGVPGRVAAPPIPLLLRADSEYRGRTAAGGLRTIAPRRFNPTGEAWLPIMHLDLEGWFFTALFSNTALAHRRGTTRDWVVLIFEREAREGQCTVVTETQGDLAGRRVVRGREEECRQHYTQGGVRLQTQPSQDAPGLAHP